PELKDMLRELDVPVGGKKGELITRIKLARLDMPQLVQKCKDLGISHQGGKRELVRDIQEKEKTAENEPGHPIEVEIEDCNDDDDEWETDESEDESEDESADFASQNKGGKDTWFVRPLEKCEKCEKKMELTQAEDHLKECWFEEGPANVFYLEAQAFQVMNIHLILPLNASFDDLDEALRMYWMECCGHLSQFWYRKNSAPFQPPSSYQDSCIQKFKDDFGFSDTPTKLMSTKLKKILTTKNQLIRYEYDIGTTTECLILFHGCFRVKGKPKMIDNSALIMRNIKPKIPCGKCKKPAKYLLNNGGMEYASPTQFFCSKKCGRGEEEEMLMGYFNSPRSGACGFDG
ncbi:unnamed protein product, partial [Owenia fusiformis]